MKFSLRQLQVFYLVATHNSVSLAAKELDISQSAASMSLSQLETLLDKPLFTRKGHRMELTSWGEWLRPLAHDLLATGTRIQAGMQDMDLVSGSMALGSSQTPALHLVPQLISQLDKDFPRLAIELGVENTEHVIDGLLDFRYDLGLIEGHCDDERVERSIWCNDELVIVASADHPLSSLDEVSFEQLSQERWVLREPGAGTREVFDLNIHKHIDQLQVHREYDQASVILELVKNAEYLSGLSSRSVQPWVDAGAVCILNVPELNMERKFSFIWRKQDSENPARDIVIEAARKLVE
ncbi:LysR family transcriptional regulator [Reinekea marinisedimentorum]|uniref:DNA-binding transcriptional LysR family regulator n=1 Tax=Reinekea marinisedimentorum TaxID=230495 RepID=A0A4R3I0G8_9GAMM|nr:LysR family transcriptional regulator [Reinekea marinisedimentorum]TCS38151.1 DNA-binding transcriptional LysR family regulator [Reinekea marinisedimentorum]